ncbi:lysophospholipid acyltransferase family protein [Neolewinella persica]|uniref:lysophospholipid acyltransferase family protein n=1 Tax=Neolewinella persica TaxID=70998 RepID=UPI00037E5CB6|nr:lysophospholipid acyltransferase family protein [Neolewinella persica]
MYSKLRGILRLFVFFFGTLLYVIRYLAKALITGHDVDRGLRLRKEWVGYLLRWMGVRIMVEGTLPEGGGLLVSNHRSYLDPVVLLRDVRAIAVAKKEVLDWPIIGYGARISGAIFVDRSNKESRHKTREAIGEVIRNGYFIINYPEGTTHGELRTIRFNPGAFVEAMEEKSPVYPVATDFRNPDDAWAGDETFLPHFIRCFGKRHTDVRIRYGPRLHGDSAEAILAQSQAFIDRALEEFREEWERLDLSD